MGFWGILCHLRDVASIHNGTVEKCPHLMLFAVNNVSACISVTGAQSNSNKQWWHYLPWWWLMSMSYLFFITDKNLWFTSCLIQSDQGYHVIDWVHRVHHIHKRNWHGSSFFVSNTKCPENMAESNYINGKVCFIITWFSPILEVI